MNDEGNALRGIVLGIIISLLGGDFVLAMML